MGKSYPSARKASRTTIGVSNTLTNREYVGGNSKAGLGAGIGRGPYAQQAVANRSPTIAGPYYPIAGLYGFVNPARDLFGNTILLPNGRLLYYPINFNNQLTGVSEPLSRYGPTRAPADGVNNNFRLRLIKKLVRFF